MIRWIAGAAIVGLVCSCSSANNATRRTVPRSPAALVSAHSSTPDPQVPSPPPPPFGYCGGLRTVADAQWIVRGGAAVAFVEADVAGPPVRIPHVTGAVANVVTHVHVLAGRLPRPVPPTFETPGLPAGSYLLLLGYLSGTYFVAFGMYGAYELAGGHGYRLCYAFDRRGRRHVRTGITRVADLTHLFASALRSSPGSG